MGARGGGHGARGAQQHPIPAAPPLNLPLLEGNLFLQHRGAPAHPSLLCTGHRPGGGACRP